MLKRPEAVAALKDFVVAVLYTDKHKQYREVQNRRFKEVSLPLYVVVGPDGAERSRLAGQINLAQFLDFLKKGENTTVGVVHPRLEPALAEAQATGKPVLLEFGDYTNSLSLIMRETVLKQAAVQAQLRKFVHARLLIDAGEEARKNRNLLMERFRAGSSPFYVTLGANGEERSRAQGRISEQEFLAFLEKGVK
ncbi:MAG TPA: hypothetical protein VFS19_06065 [Planctomycetota bacterium]|nr:hypothetical protein [Planctomycetota bacterium]